MLSKDLEQTLNGAFKEARAKRHEFMTVEHLLLALLDNETAIEVLKAVGADIEQLRKDLVEYIESTTPLISDRKLLVSLTATDFMAQCSGPEPACAMEFRRYSGWILPWKKPKQK